MHLPCLFLYGFGLVACVAGCGDTDSSSPSSSSGELGHGDFTYGCYDATDVYCAQQRTTFPGTIALGGAFELDFADTGSRAARVVTGSALIEGDDFGFRAIQPGFAAMLALDGDSQVVDLLHVRIVAPDDLLISTDDARVESFMPLELTLGQKITARVEPLDPRGNSMAGSLEYDWSPGDGSLLAVIKGRGGAEVTLSPLAVGELELVVNTGDLEVPFTVLISEAEPAPSGDVDATDAGSPSSDDTSDADASPGMDGTDQDAGEGGPVDLGPPDAGPASTDAAAEGGAQ